MCVAPMMRYSHRHARQLWRMLCPSAILYTEMLPAAALAREINPDWRHHPEQSPVVLQLAGNKPNLLAAAAAQGEKLGYDQINLNCGCPSSRVTAGGFGACLMAQPDLVYRLIAAMRAACDLPISVKCRIAIDDRDPQDCLMPFVSAVCAAGSTTVIVHVRRAILGGLNPKQNRTRPALEPHWAVKLKQHLPNLQVISNGGIGSVREAQLRADGVDGVMLGRAVVARPALLAEFRTVWYKLDKVEIADVALNYLNYCAAQLKAGAHPRRLLAPLAGLVSGQIGARGFRRNLQNALGTGELAPLRAHWQ